MDGPITHVSLPAVPISLDIIIDSFREINALNCHAHREGQLHLIQ